MPMHDYYWGGGGWGAWMIFHWLFWLALLALVIWSGIMLSRRSRWSDSDSPKSALELLNERYARGEIDREEYLQRRKDIEER